MVGTNGVKPKLKNTDGQPARKLQAHSCDSCKASPGMPLASTPANEAKVRSVEGEMIKIGKHPPGPLIVWLAGTSVNGGVCCEFSCDSGALGTNLLPAKLAARFVSHETGARKIVMWIP